MNAAANIETIPGLLVAPGEGLMAPPWGAMGPQLRTIYVYIYTVYTGWPKKTSRTLCKYNGAYTSWGKISFGTFVDQHVLLLTYKFQ